MSDGQKIYITIPEYKYFNQERTLFQDIEDIAPIKIILPDKPSNYLIDNYQRPVANQKWHRTLLPKSFGRFKGMSKDDIYSKLTKEENDFILREYDRIENGYWFYNNGDLLWISGTNYMYLNWWKIDIGYPDFRMCDTEYFWHWWKICNDPDAAGMIDLERRRSGKSNRAGVIAYAETFTRKDVLTGIQSKTDDDGNKFFQKTIVKPWKRLPFFLQPTFDSSNNPRNELRFYSPTIRGLSAREDLATDDALQSNIEVRSSIAIAFDGEKLHRSVDDEAGKLCFSMGTPILMFDGSIKNVEDVKKGELVMGDDSSPRKILKMSSGNEPLYRIIPKGNGMVWACNGNHILSLKWCHGKRLLRGKYKKEDTVNINIKDYLKLNSFEKQHLVLYSVGVDFPEKHHAIDPYFVGLWLGDGTTGLSSISNIDKEVIDYLKRYASKNKLNYSVDKRGVRHNLSCNKTKTVEMYDSNWIYEKTFSSVKGAAEFVDVYSSCITWASQTGNSTKKHKWKIVSDIINPILNFLKKENLIREKHIPKDYLFDSRKNRLKLLAGLMDSDGHKDKRKDAYEITQKREDLSYQISYLAKSLGFKSRIKKKVATMKRSDGSIYSCPVWRVGIYGSNLYEIPCLVERKKCHKKTFIHKNTRNPLRHGFKVEPIGKGDFFGFSVDKNHLFLLGDFTVAHNSDESIIERWMQVKRLCVQVDNKIVGKGLVTSSVGEMVKGGGDEFKTLWDYSDHSKKTDGRTASWLEQHYIPSWDGYVIDEFGRTLKEEGLALLAKNFARLKGKPFELSAEKRQFPRNLKEAFRISIGECKFNIEVIDSVLEKYTFDNPNITYGNFKWKDGKQDTEVIFVPCEKQSARWIVSYLFESPSMSNKKQLQGGSWYPGNFHFGTLGADPFRVDEVVSKKKSMGTGVVFRGHDPNIDHEYKDVSEWKTNCFIASYCNRPLRDEYCEDMLMACVYYGIPMFPEMNLVVLMDYFKSRGYGGFLLHQKDAHYRISKVPGANTNAKSIGIMFSEMDSWIDRHGLYTNHPEILEACRDADPSHLQPSDLFVAATYALTGERSKKISYSKKNGTEISRPLFNVYDI